MKSKYEKVIASYFRDILQIVLLLTGLFLICLIALFIINGFRAWNFLLVVVYLLIMAIFYKPLSLWLKANGDLNKEAFETASIEVDSIEPDKPMNIYSKEGLSGNIKYILTTTDGEKFLVSEQRAKSAAKMNSKNVLVKRSTFEIAYLKDSRMIVDMKPTTVFEDPEVNERYKLAFISLYRQFR